VRSRSEGCVALTDLANNSQVRISQPGLRSGIYVLEGPPGRGIESIARTAGSGAPGTVDTYTITYEGGGTTTYQVTNGEDGTSGRAVSTIARTAGSGAPGTVDTYTITYSDATTSTFTVTNGADGTDGTDGVGLPAGGTAGQVVAKASGADYDYELVAPPSGGGLALTRKTHDPTSSTDVGTTSTSAVDVSASNLVVTFTVPTSGTVRVTLQAMPSGPSNANIFWTLREGTTDLAVGRPVAFSTTQVRAHVEFVITGLTPGATKTWKWAHYVNSGTGYTSFGGGRTAGSARGPAVMEVYPA